jgi:hypothetical protein
MSGRMQQRRWVDLDPPRRPRRNFIEDYRFRSKKLEPYYDAENDYHFAEAKEEFGVDSTDFQWFENAEGDTIDDMSSALNESQRRAVRWRITAIRVIGVLNAIALLGGCLPTWIMMLRWNRESILAEKESVRCESAFQHHGDGGFKDSSCVFYRHELSTYTAFVGLWMFGTLLQSFFMIFTAWRLHNKSFQAVVSIWTFVFLVLGLAVAFYTTTNLTLMAEDFNWRIASPVFRVATWTGDVKGVLTESLRAFLGILYGLLVTQAIWMVLMHQVLQFGLNLQEFGTEICGDSIDAAAQENAIAMHSVVGRLLDDDELREEAHPSHGGDVEEDEFELLGYEEDDGEPPYDHEIAEESNPTLNSIMEMMSTLTSTMSSLNQKINSIESRVGDGTALLVMPPGENQWDARKEPVQKN